MSTFLAAAGARPFEAVPVSGKTVSPEGAQRMALCSAVPCRAVPRERHPVSHTRAFSCLLPERIPLPLKGAQSRSRLHTSAVATASLCCEGGRRADAFRMWLDKAGGLWQ